jgi:hypothetical protein
MAHFNSLQCLYMHAAAVSKLPGGSWLGTVSEVLGRVPAVGQLLMADQQSDSLEIEAVFSLSVSALLHLYYLRLLDGSRGNRPWLGGP